MKILNTKLAVVCLAYTIPKRYCFVTLSFKQQHMMASDNHHKYLCEYYPWITNLFTCDYLTYTETTLHTYNEK